MDFNDESYELVDRIADAFVEFLAISPGAALSFAQRMSNAFGFEKEYQWVPALNSGQEGQPVRSFKEIELMMEVSPAVARADREYRFVSRWFRPSRDG